jgi:hypothetical protein
LACRAAARLHTGELIAWRNDIPLFTLKQSYKPDLSLEMSSLGKRISPGNSGWGLPERAIGPITGHGEAFEWVSTFWTFSTQIAESSIRYDSI